MSEFKFNKGDKVVIVENKMHPDYVRAKYGKVLTIEKRIVSSDGDNLYKIKGIKNWAYEDDLKLYIKTGVELIAEERKRQIEVEGWTLEHDLRHKDNDLAIAASCYCLPPGQRDFRVRDQWPFEYESWKPTPENRIKELQKAGALIAAEIDRLQHSN